MYYSGDEKARIGPKSSPEIPPDLISGAPWLPVAGPQRKIISGNAAYRIGLYRTSSAAAMMQLMTSETACPISTPL
jgi:hypothetical protein